jgi:HAD superfamily phosphatase (TIGR01668 family)
MSDYLPLKRSLVRSEESVDMLYSLQPEWLYEMGIKGVLIDLENTLIPYGATALSAQAKELLKRLMEAGLTVLVASNAARSPVAEELRAVGIPCRLRSWKPFSVGLNDWFRTNNLRGPDTLVIGDQVLTDGLLAVFRRSHLLLITPLSTDEPVWAKTQRLIGRLVRPLVLKTGKRIVRD